MDPVSRRLALAFALVMALSACHGDTPAARSPTSPGPTQTLDIATANGPVHLTVELAVTAAQQQEGLMGRTSLPPDAGMAFLFDEPTTVHFWMKDTLIPLSIAFWDQDGRIVALEEMTPCTQDPCPTYGPDVPYRGAVEANAGFFTKHHVAVGDTVSWGMSRP
jgi:uncharacterized protein